MTDIVKRSAPLIGIIILWACNTTTEERLEVIYTSNGNLVGKNTASIFDQSVQQGGYILLSGLSDVVSVARKDLLTHVAWDVQAWDALGGAPIHQIKVIPTLGGAAGDIRYATTLIDGGIHRQPALAFLGERLYCMWSGEGGIYLSSTSNGRDWTIPVRRAIAAGSVTGIDLTAHNDRLYIAGVVTVGSATGPKRLFAAQVNVNSEGNDFTLAMVNDDVVPGDHPSDNESVSLASDGSRLWLGYVRDNTSQITRFEGGSWLLSSSLIHEFSSIREASRPALAVVRNYLYACFRNGALLTVKRRPLNSNTWEGDNLHVNDAQADAARGIDCHRITVSVEN